MASKIEKVIEQVEQVEHKPQPTALIHKAEIIGGDRIILTVRGKAVDEYPLLAVYETRGLRFQVVGISTLDAEEYSVELARVG